MPGVVITLVALWALWVARGKLTVHGLEYLRWEPTAPRWAGAGIGCGAGAALVFTALFQRYRVDALPRFADLWMGITLGPVIEEFIFRGYLFAFLSAILVRWKAPAAGWVTLVVIAALFALGHVAKPDITPPQVASIFAMGCLYGWLRLRSGSTVPSTIAHIAYNAVIYGVAALRAL